MSDSTLLKIEQANITDEVKESIRLIEDLKFFLATAPANWQNNQVIRRYYLNSDEGYVSCIFWNNLYFITGTDIVRCIVYKFQHFGRKIIDRKKFEEGIFSDLRNLKCGTDAILESPKSDFLNFLFKNACLRTQKKQKVFFWFNVPHDKLMADALERDLKKEKQNQTPTTIADREPALSFEYEEEKLLYTHLIEQNYNKKLTDGDTTDETFDTTTSTNNSNDQDESTLASDRPKLSSKSKLSKKKTADSPEYLSKSAAGFEFLNQETPDQFKQHNSEDEDEFPLDYFEGHSSEYILIDPNSQNYSMANLYDENHDFIANHNYLPYASQPVAANDEYLIEQTLPIKTPLSVPRSAKFGPSEDHYHFPPLSAKLPYGMPRFQEPPLSAKSQSSQSQSQSQQETIKPQFVQSSQAHPQPQTIQVPPPPPTAGALPSALYSQSQDPYFFPQEQEYWPSFPEQLVANQGLVGAGGYMFSDAADPMNNYYPPPSAVLPFGPYGGPSGHFGMGGPVPGSATAQGFFPHGSMPPGPPLSATATNFNQKQFGQLPPSFPPPGFPHSFPPSGPGPHLPHSFPGAPSFVVSPSFAGPSSRQQAISSNMMKKKIQMKKQGQMLTSPEVSNITPGATSNPLHMNTSKNSITKPKSRPSNLKSLSKKPDSSKNSNKK